MMKLKQTFILIFLITIIGCTKNDISINQELFLKKVITNGFETRNYDYSNGKLQKLIFRRNLFDPGSQTSFIDTTEFLFEYLGDKVDKIIESNNIYSFDIENEDLWIRQIQNSDTLLQIQFKNFEEPNLSTINIIHTDIYNETIIATINDSNNIIFATDENNINAEDAYDSLTGLMDLLFGIMEYDNKKNIYSNLQPEIRLWLWWDKNSNNLLKRSMNEKIWEFEYEYNELDYPIISKRVIHNTIDNTSSDTIVTKYEYISE